MPLPPLIQSRLAISTEVGPDSRLPRKYRRLVAKVAKQDFTWLRDHPDERMRIRPAVRGEFWPSYLHIGAERQVAVQFEPTSYGVIGYERIPLWDAHPSTFVPESPSESCEMN